MPPLMQVSSSVRSSPFICTYSHLSPLTCLAGAEGGPESDTLTDTGLMIVMMIVIKMMIVMMIVMMIT